MTAPATMQIPGFQGVVTVLDHDGCDEARAVGNGIVDLFRVNQNFAPATRR